MRTPDQSLQQQAGVGRLLEGQGSSGCWAGAMVVMPQIMKLEYTEPLVREAVVAFWRRSLGVGFFVCLGFLLCVFLFMVWEGDRSWGVGALGAFLVLGVGFIVFLYFVHLRNGLAKLRSMGEPTATLSLEDESFTITSGLGSTSLKWSVVTELWRFPSFWLLLFSNAQFITVPLASVPAEAQEFMMNRVRAAGGKIVA